MAQLSKFESYFRVISYLVALSGLFALFAAGAIGISLFAVFILVTVLSWKLEDTRWQLSERLGVVIILIAIPLFLADWRFKLTGFGANELLAAASLAKLILFLLAIKLLQKKSDRDWIFIYLISFFQILLAAGVSISPLYVASLFAFLFLTACAIIAFEIRKTSGEVHRRRAENLSREKSSEPMAIKLGGLKLPSTAVLLITITVVIGLPLFFVLPRVGGAGITGGFSDTTRITGFSDSVRLGTIGRLQQNDATVMRVRIDRNDNPNLSRFLWRGVALDRFENNTWSRSNKRYSEPFAKTTGSRFVVDFARREGLLTVQTVYLEPLNSSILFVMPRAIVIRSNANEISKDAEGGFNAYPATYERTSYTVYSDTYLPEPDALRADNGEYASRSFKYLTLPADTDPRIGSLATRWIREETALTRYDIAKAIEQHLQNDFKYSLDMKAGGPDPLSDFLFNVKEGHCEYYATAMAVMLRTQGIATRVVNGFQQGEYNETAGVYVVRQKNAHSWVEVYFPENDVWVPFDPTPFAGRNPDALSGGILSSISGYLEALETFWIQYFVAYDDQEQRSLFRSFKEGLTEYRDTGANWLNSLQTSITRWWQALRGDEGLWSSARAVGIAAGLLIGASLFVILLVWLWRRISNWQVWGRLASWFSRSDEAVIIGFYARLQDVLEQQGLVRKPHQTPLEFAYLTGYREAVKITEKYNGVRFGAKDLTDDESESIENWLKDLETMEKDGH
ncbi:MAG: DUF3488 domain-containing protein [Acidobacteria bacterium]|nr:MAG: DUF3488 domain-containing protein [Acidobacteriota bacterium]REK02124.1 MAG: DUF3488 domain-containing protein [Acidobacteriota bacterium]REK14074.1 MAG: DUF3488 domain-containing protein [Acidobacteriota bacterium]REK42069.1 MAG: DUF3488 domain-containing protein [Acidobacteriota bacterium]